MKIALIVKDYACRGGIERVVVELAEGLSLNHEVHIFANSFDGVVGKSIRCHHVPFLNVPSPKFFFIHQLSFSFCLRWIMRKYHFDIIHDHWLAYPYPDVVTFHSCHICSLRMRRKKARKELSRKFSLTQLWKCLKLLINPNDYLINYLGKKQAQKCHSVIAISESERRNLIRYFHVSPEKMVTIYHGVNTEVFHPRNRDIHRREIRSKIGISQNDLLLLFVAHRFKEKNLDILLEAFSRLNEINISLLVAGAGEKEIFEETIKKLNLQNRVFFIGCSKEMEKIYGAGDILILPSSYEPFGMAVLEAMATGLPVIVSGLAGAAELITDRENGILLKDPTNPEEILEKLSLLAKNEQLRKSIGQAARRTAEKYDWKKNINQTLRLYQDVLENKSITG